MTASAAAAARASSVSAARAAAATRRVAASAAARRRRLAEGREAYRMSAIQNLQPFGEAFVRRWAGPGPAAPPCGDSAPWRSCAPGPRCVSRGGAGRGWGRRVTGGREGQWERGGAGPALTRSPRRPLC